jgi:ribonuclease P protein component
MSTHVEKTAPACAVGPTPGLFGPSPHSATARPRGSLPERPGLPVGRGSGTLAPLPDVRQRPAQRIRALANRSQDGGLPVFVIWPYTRDSTLCACAGQQPVSTARSRPRVPTSARASEEAMGETHIPTEQPEAEEEARIPSPDAQSSRPCGDPASPHQGPFEALGLIWRVRGQSSFRALARGRRRHAGNLEVRQAVLAPRAEPPRVAFAVGRSVGNAVTRNRVRRRLRAAMHDQAAQLTPGTGYLVRATPGAAESTYHELSDTLSAILAGFSDVSR